MNKILLDKLMKEQDEKYGEVFQRLAEGDPNGDYVWEEDRQKEDAEITNDEDEKER